jgi:hypothetical protein
VGADFWVGRALAVGASVALSGCARTGSAPSSGQESAVAVVNTPAQSTAVERGSATSSGADRLTLDAGATEPEAVKDAASIVHAVLSAQNLQQYLHFELTSRRPLLLVTSNLVTSGLVLPAFEHPVRVVEPNEVAVGQPHLVLTRRASTPMTVTVSIDYPIEGLSGEIQLEKHGREWTIVSSALRER